LALFKRGNVYWSYVWVDGIRHAKSTGTANRRSAERIDQRFKEELNLARMGVVEPKPEMTFSELAARFLADASPRPYHIDRLKLLLPYWGKTEIGRITKAGAREYRAHRHRTKKNLSDTTVNRDLEALRHMLFWSVDEGILLANPLSRVLMVRERRKRYDSTKRRKIVTPEKKTDQAQKTSPAANEGGRKPWTPRSPVEVVLEQITKQEKKVAELQVELDTEKSMLTKLLQAKKILEST